MQTLERRNLEYHGRRLTWDPVNVDTEAILDSLDADEPCVIMLEPGDATRYVFMLVPLTGDGVRCELRWAGITPADADRYMLVVKLASQPRDQGWAWVPWEPGVAVGVHDVSDIHQNDWSKEVIAWWLTELRRIVDDNNL